MENKESEKSCLAEILGVEVGEKFRIQTNGGFMTFEVTADGNFKTDPPQQVGSAYLLLDAINHPEKIIHQPRLTPEELAICKALGARWVSRNGTPFCEDFVELWENEPCRSADSAQYINNYDENFVASIRSGSFPSINPGDCVNVEEQ